MNIRLIIWYFEEVSNSAEIRKNPFELELSSLNCTGYELKEKLAKIIDTDAKDILVSTSDKLIIDGELKLKNYKLQDRSILLMRKNIKTPSKVIKNLSMVFACGVAFGIGYYCSCYVIKNYLGGLKEIPNLFKKVE